MIRVLLADDQALVRAGFRALLDAQDGIEVVGEAEDGRQAVELAAEQRPDVILMDIRMPVLDGLAATREIALDRQLDSVRIVILTTFELDEYVFEAIRAGAAGIPGQGHQAERLDRGGAGRRRRRCAALTFCHPPADRGVRGAGEGATELDRSRGADRPRARGHGARRRRAFERSRSQPGSSSASRPRRHTSAGRWSSSASATAPSWSSWPTRPDSCAPAGLVRRNGEGSTISRPQPVAPVRGPLSHRRSEEEEPDLEGQKRAHHHRDHDRLDRVDLPPSSRLCFCCTHAEQPRRWLAHRWGSTGHPVVGGADPGQSHHGDGLEDRQCDHRRRDAGHAQRLATRRLRAEPEREDR